MTISYNWLSEYLDVKPDPKRLSEILTAIGLEVESMENYESVKGNLEGLVIGKVTFCDKHPNADKLSVTKVNTGGAAELQIVCGAQNVAIGQTVVVAPVGVTIYPISGEPLTMKQVKIRGIESQGMICAEDEIGLGDNHAGIIVIPENITPGTFAADYYKLYSDIIYEIGLTPNRMDAMSHLGVARDVAAYLAYHDKLPVAINFPFPESFTPDNKNIAIQVEIVNNNACKRYAGVAITGIQVKPSPSWLQAKLKAIGVSTINNIVDITNYILHETGQPLHAFDAAAITGNKVLVKNLPGGSVFTTLDQKERRLSSEDLMICNEEKPMCIAGVFGGFESGVKDATTSIFLESAWFNPSDIRKTSFRHGLRTDAAGRFEKGIDISNTVKVLQRAALMIKDLAGGVIASDIIDVYSSVKEKTTVKLPFNYLRKLSGKDYPQTEVNEILSSLGFETIVETSTDITVTVPYHKMDVSIPADLVEEILRIDGYDNVEIPGAITISPSVQKNKNGSLKEKLAALLMGSGFNEIMTNSITNSAFFSDEILSNSVKMLNSLSAELDLMRPSLMETGLQAVAYNLNRRQQDLAFFEFGRSYTKKSVGVYGEQDHLVIFMTGRQRRDSWKNKWPPVDMFNIKGVCAGLLKIAGLDATAAIIAEHDKFQYGTKWQVQDQPVATCGLVSKKLLSAFDIRQPVYFADINWDVVQGFSTAKNIRFQELPRQLAVHRDLSMLIPKSMAYEQVQLSVARINLKKLKQVELFDIFESEKLGAGKKSMAVSFNFLDEEKTLTDKEIDTMMSRIIATLENECGAEIRK